LFFIEVDDNYNQNYVNANLVDNFTNGNNNQDHKNNNNDNVHTNDFGSILIWVDAVLAQVEGFKK
jgi:hypothetical protein